jgi:hypothetical protein
MELCNMAVSKLGFTMAIVFIWTTRMLGEFRSVERLHRDMHAIANLPEDAEVKHMLHYAGGDPGQEEYHIIALSRCTRLFIYLLVIIPKLLIVLILMFIGCRWLAATESFSDLILNALALEFVIGVDELVYENFAPVRMQEWVSGTQILHLKHTSNASSGSDADLWPYIKSIGYMALCFSWSFLYLNNLQQVIPSFPHDIHEHCGGWFRKYYQPSCAFGTMHPELCFPYGDQGGD